MARVHPRRRVKSDIFIGFDVCFKVHPRSKNSGYIQWRRQLWDTGARAPPRLPTIILFLVHFGVNLRANYPTARLADADINNSQLGLSISTTLVTKLSVIEQLL